MKLVRQGDTSPNQDVSLALLQETLAEARAAVELHGTVPPQDEVRGLDSRQITSALRRRVTKQAVRLRIAKEIKDEPRLTVLISHTTDVRQLLQ